MNAAYRSGVLSMIILSMRCSTPLIVMWLCSASALGQTLSPTVPIGGEPPTAGVRLHTSPLIGRVDAATAIELNPAALGLLPS